MSAEPNSKRRRSHEPSQKRRLNLGLHIDIALANIAYEKEIYDQLLNARVEYYVIGKCLDGYTFHKESDKLCFGNCVVCVYVLHERHMKKLCDAECRFCKLNLSKGTPLRPDGFYPPYNIMKQISSKTFLSIASVIETCIIDHNRPITIGKPVGYVFDSDGEDCDVCAYLNHRNYAQHNREHCIFCGDSEYWNRINVGTFIEDISKDDFSFLVDHCEQCIKARTQQC